MTVLDILRTFGGIPPLTAFLVFSASIWVYMGKSEGWKIFCFFFNPQYAIMILVLFNSMVNYLNHCSILVSVCEKRV